MRATGSEKMEKLTQRKKLSEENKSSRAKLSVRWEDGDADGEVAEFDDRLQLRLNTIADVLEVNVEVGDLAGDLFDV